MMKAYVNSYLGLEVCLLILVKYQQMLNCWEKSFGVVEKVNNITNKVNTKPFWNKVTTKTVYVNRLEFYHIWEVVVNFRCSREKGIQTEHKIKK